MVSNEQTQHYPRIKPPRGLLSQIIKRLGLEKQFRIVKRHLGFFATILLVFLLLSIFAFIGLKEVLSESSFGPYLSLIFSDPGTVLKDWHSFGLSVSESMPGITIVGLLLSVAFLMLFARFVSVYFGKFLSLSGSIKKQKQTYVK